MRTRAVGVQQHRPSEVVVLERQPLEGRFERVPVCRCSISRVGVEPGDVRRLDLEDAVVRPRRGVRQREGDAVLEDEVRAHLMLRFRLGQERRIAESTAYETGIGYGYGLELVVEV